MTANRENGLGGGGSDPGDGKKSRWRQVVLWVLLLAAVTVVLVTYLAQWKVMGAVIEALAAGAALAAVGSLVLNAETLTDPVHPKLKRVSETAAVVGGVIGVVPLVAAQGLGLVADDVGSAMRVGSFVIGIGVAIIAGVFLEVLLPKVKRASK